MPLLNKIFTLLVIALFLSCGDNTKNQQPNFSIKTNAEGGKIQLGKTLSLSLKNSKNLEISGTTFSLNDKTIDSNFKLENVKLGKQTIKAVVSHDGKVEEVSTSITILSNKKPDILSFEIINEYPHDITSYTQGLEFHNGKLYESTGQYGESKLRITDHKTGEIIENVDLTSSFFGEGLTILNNNIYQLTWQENTGFIYDAETLEKKSSFKYGQSKEGWGICNDGNNLYKSDGTEKIWTLNPDTLTEEKFVQVYTHKGMIPSLNELEWIDGKIYANIYQRNGVVIINPVNGMVESVIDFSSLKKKVTQHEGLDVLNGLAYNPDRKTLFVTGKRWDKIFEVRIVE